MTLTYGKSSPWDVLAKAERDLLRLGNAEKAGDAQSASDALFDVAVTVLALKDWLKEHPSASYARSTVESYANASRAFQARRDLANAGKHREISRYQPSTSGIEASTTAHASPSTDAAGPEVYRTLIGRLKVVAADNSRHRATDLARQAIHDWAAFMEQHGIGR